MCRAGFICQVVFCVYMARGKDRRACGPFLFRGLVVTHHDESPESGNAFGASLGIVKQERVSLRFLGYSLSFSGDAFKPVHHEQHH